MTPPDEREQHDDTLIDAALDEVLGGLTPPDLTNQILRRLRESERSSNDGPGGPLPTTPPPIQVRTENTSRPVVAIPRRPRRPKKSRSWWLGIGLSLAFVATAVGLVVAHYSSQNQMNVPILADGDRPTQGPAQQRDSNTASTEPRENSDDTFDSPRDKRPREKEQSNEPLDQNTVVQSRPQTDEPSESQLETDGDNVRPETIVPLDDTRIVQLIDKAIAAQWELANVQPAPALQDESEWCQRVFQRVLGRDPTSGEQQQFLRQTFTDKRARLVEKLVTADRYASELADHWSVMWTEILLNGRVDVDRLRRSGLQIYLRKAFRENLPYDQLVMQLIVAEGCDSVQSKEYNPATSYLLSVWDEQGIQPAADVCRVFLGLRVQCAQCHDHTQNSWTQEDFWRMTAFFRQTRRKKDGRQTYLVNQDFHGDSSASLKEADTQYTTDDEKRRSVFPQFLNGETIARSGRVEDVNRRAELARLLTDSRQLGRMAVSRIWRHFFGYGFTTPVDDMGSHNRPSHSRLVDQLADQFRMHEYDLRKLTAWVALSDAFSRASTITSGNKVDMPQIGRTALFTRVYHRPTLADAVGDSLIKVARTPNLIKSDESRNPNAIGMIRELFDQTKKKRQNTANKDSSERPRFHQIQLLFDSLSKSTLSLEEKVEHLFMAMLGRSPTEDELRRANELARSRGESEEFEVLAEIWLAIEMSLEYVSLH